jgi:hypothetical protein
MYTLFHHLCCAYHESTMSAPQTPHPAAGDLANLAQEKLGRKKTQRILDHCKECPECADRLLEVVRAQPLAGERPALSKWNWISIGIFVVALVVVVVVMLWLLRSVSQRGGVEFEASGAVSRLAGRVGHGLLEHR